MFKNTKKYVKQKRKANTAQIDSENLRTVKLVNDTISKRKNLGTTNWYVYQIQHVEDSKYTRNLYHLEFTDCVHKSRIHTLQRTFKIEQINH